MQLTTTTAKIRLGTEILMWIAALLYIMAALREANFLGLNMFIENLVRLNQLYSHSSLRELNKLIIIDKSYTILHVSSRNTANNMIISETSHRPTLREIAVKTKEKCELCDKRVLLIGYRKNERETRQANGKPSSTQHPHWPLALSENLYQTANNTGYKSPMTNETLANKVILNASKKF